MWSVFKHFIDRSLRVNRLTVPHELEHSLEQSTVVKDIMLQMKIAGLTQASMQ